MFPGLDLYYTDPAQQLVTAGSDLDDLSDLDRHESDFCNLNLCKGPHDGS